MATQVRITNTYPDRTNSRTVTVADPEVTVHSTARNLRMDADTGELSGEVISRAIDPASRQDLEDWWNETVMPETGDGRGQSQRAVYLAEVISSDVPELIGLTHAWEG